MSSRSCRLFSAGFAALFLAACAGAPKVTRTDVDEVVDLSGNWNDTDSRLTSEEMVKDSLSRPWLDEFTAAKKTKPRVIVGTVLNKSDEHINTETFDGLANRCGLTGCPSSSTA